jgi:cytochrome c oxidase assembly protein subunit 15
VVVWAFLLVAVVVLRQATRGHAAPGVVGRGRLVLGAVVAQGALGYLQYFAGVPEIMVAGHVLGSVIVWVAVLRFHLALTEPVPAEAPATAARSAPGITPVAPAAT